MDELPPIESDRLIHGSEITHADIEPGSPLSIRLRNKGPSVDYLTQIEFTGVRYYQFSSDSFILLDSVEVFRGVEAALEVPSIKSVLTRSDRAALHLDVVRGSYLHWLKDEDVTVYRLVQLTGGESFVICEGIRREPWTTVERAPEDRVAPRPQIAFGVASGGEAAVHAFFGEFARAEGLEYSGSELLGDGDPMPNMNNQRIFAGTLSRGKAALAAVAGNFPGREGRFNVLFMEPSPDPEFVARLTDGLKAKWPDTTLHQVP